MNIPIINSKANQALKTADGVQTQLNQAIADGDQLAETQQARVDENGNSHTTLKDRIDSSVESLKQKDAELTTQVSQKLNQSRVGGLQPAPLRNVQITTNVDEPIILDVWGGYVWGIVGDSIYRRNVTKGSQWELYTENGMNCMRMLPTSDDEVLILRSGTIYKSNNFHEPDNLTWDLKYTTNDTAYHLRWGFDGDGTKFIAGTYAAQPNWHHSRYVVVSLDAGETFNIVYDTETIHGTTGSHIHAVAYDKYADRFYISEGHGDIAGIYVSTNDGQTWNRAPGMVQSPAPTTITVTPDGLVCGSDNNINGIYGVVRMEDPMDEELVLTWEWKTGRDGLIGFAQRGFYDDKSGLVYVSFRSNFTSIKPVIAAGTPTSGGLIYEWDSGGVTDSDGVTNIVVADSGEVLAYAVAGSERYDITAISPPPGASQINDKGNMFGGESNVATSIAIGKGASVSAQHSLAIGLGAVITGVQFSNAIGNNAKAGTSAVSVGESSESENQSVAIGHLAKSLSTSVAVGANAINHSTNSTAVGRSAQSGANSVSVGNGSVGDNNAVSIGKDATAGIRGIALGENAKAEYQNSVAIGRNVETSLNDQVNIGKKHVVIEQFPTINISGSLPENSGAFFVRRSNDQLQLCFKFSDSNTVHVLLTSETLPN